MSVEIRPLTARPECARSLADWHYAEWGALYGAEWSWQAAYDELLEHAQGQSWPTTLIAEHNGDLLGSVSLVESDAAPLDPLGSPWLASLYVRPAARGHGVAKQLVKGLCELAAEQGHSKLFLFTPHHAAYYAELGWQAMRTADLHGRSVEVMVRTLREQVTA